MKLIDKVSQAVKNSKLYDLDHFHEAWENPSLRRLMGNELIYPPSPKVIEAVQARWRTPIIIRKMQFQICDC